MTNLEPLKNALLTITSELPHDGELHFKSMFGGACAYFNGRVFASLSHAGLALKLSEKDREQLLAIGGQMLQYAADMPVSKSYVVVPETIWRDPDDFLRWARRSVDYILELPAPRARKKS